MLDDYGYERPGRNKWSFKIDLLAIWRWWRKRCREKRKRKLIAHQEAYARALKYRKGKR